MVDDDDIDLCLRGFQLQAELILKCSEYVRGAVSVAAVTGGGAAWRPANWFSIRRPAQTVKSNRPLSSGLINHGPIENGRLHHVGKLADLVEFFRGQIAESPEKQAGIASNT